MVEFSLKRFFRLGRKRHDDVDGTGKTSRTKLHKDKNNNSNNTPKKKKKTRGFLGKKRKGQKQSDKNPLVVSQTMEELDRQAAQHQQRLMMRHHERLKGPRGRHSTMDKTSTHASHATHGTDSLQPRRRHTSAGLDALPPVNAHTHLRQEGTAQRSERNQARPESQLRLVNGHSQNLPNKQQQQQRRPQRLSTPAGVKSLSYEHPSQYNPYSLHQGPSLYNVATASPDKSDANATNQTGSGNTHRRRAPRRSDAHHQQQQQHGLRRGGPAQGPEASSHRKRPASTEDRSHQQSPSQHRQQAQPVDDPTIQIVSLKPEYLKTFSVQPFSLSEKLQRWDHVTDFDNPVPPPDTAAQLTQMMRRDSVYSGSSLMDWQSYAIKQRRRKTQV